MSKTTQWGIDKKKNKGIIKMIGLLSNMIQDHDVSEYHMIGMNERTLLSIHQELKVIHMRGTYTQSEKEFLNEVRNLVLQYQNTRKEDYIPFFINSKGQINHNLTTMSNGVA